MSLLSDAGTVLGTVFKGLGKMNASQYQDCVGAVGIYGVGGTLAKYPQCQPFAAQLGAPMMSVPQTLPGGAPLPPGYAYNTVPGAAPLQSQPISYAATPVQLPAMIAPMLGAIPKLGQMVAPLVGGAMTAMGLVKSSLPILKKSLAIASGFIVAGSLVYDSTGRLIGRTRRRRRMNPLNYRAAKRAARRLCAVQDLCGDIERALPTRSARAPRRRRTKKCR
jgi:hypothetical protein